MEPDSVAPEAPGESAALEAMLRCSSLSATEFFDTVYQHACAVFPGGAVPPPSEPSTNAIDPYTKLVRHGWEALIELLQESRKAQECASVTEQNSASTPEDQGPHHQETLLFKNQTILGPDAVAGYDGSLFAAYLDGCSAVLNHADRLSPHIASLCEDLQKSFPHAYANTYLTPPDTQSVPAHADDRDVLVVQVLGMKEWTVYQRIPVPYPYCHEQVGKNGIPVPDFVLQGPVLIQRSLRPGDVLYMPRGFVHRARALPGTLSFHVTIALATHDWSLARVVASASEHVLNQVVQYRKAVDRELGTREWTMVSDTTKHEMRNMLDSAMEAIRSQVTVELIHDALEAKYNGHNERCRPQRNRCIQQISTKPGVSGPIVRVVGREAAEKVRFGTYLRAATDEEKASLLSPVRPRGLHVKESIAEIIIHVFNKFKLDPSLICRVDKLSALCASMDETDLSHQDLCDLIWLAFAKQCVEGGGLAIVESTNTSDI